jgi:hypothetical protein
MIFKKMSLVKNRQYEWRKIAQSDQQLISKNIVKQIIGK